MDSGRVDKKEMRTHQRVLRDRDAGRHAGQLQKTQQHAERSLGRHRPHRHRQASPDPLAPVPAPADGDGEREPPRRRGDFDRPDTGLDGED